MEVDVVPFPEMLLGDDAWGAAFRHSGRMGGPDVKLAEVAILVGEVKVNEAIPMNANVDAFYVDGGAGPCVAARDEAERRASKPMLTSTLIKRSSVGAMVNEAM
jgi:hypothetical protein